MSKWLSVTIAVVFVLGVALVACAPEKEVTPTPAPPEEEKVIVIGILGALTGPAASIGPGAYAVHDYFTYITETEGGIRYNDPNTGKEEVAKVELILGDHAWETAKSLSLYERFKAEGMNFIYANGSSPTAAIYAACAKDHIPGMQLNCTCDPFIYDTETKPYMSMAAPAMVAAQPSLMAIAAQRYKEMGVAKPKIGLLAADVATRRVYDDEERWRIRYYLEEIAGIEYVGPIYMPMAPVDIKAELTHFIEAGVDNIQVDQWGDGACAVVIKDAVDLEMHKKGIDINLQWVGAPVVEANGALIDEYNEDAIFECISHLWCGTEGPEIRAKYPGVQLAFDICAKYREQTIPEAGGYYYMHGIPDGIEGHQAMRETLERVGWAGFSNEELRDGLWGVETFDTFGLFPTYHPDPEVFHTWPTFTFADIRGGQVYVTEKSLWGALGGMNLYPGWNPIMVEDDRNIVVPPPFK